MLCPNCGRELPDHESICPECGQALPETQSSPISEHPAEETPAAAEESAILTESTTEEPAVDSAEDPAVTAEETAESPEEISESPAPEEGPKPAKKKGVSPLAVAVSVIIGLLVIIVVCLTITVTTLSRTGSMPGFVTTVSDFFNKRSVDPKAIAVNITDVDGNTIDSITNAQFSYYYWESFYYELQYNSYSLDLSGDLSQTMYDEERTWQDYFVETACQTLEEIEALKAEAEAEGFTLPEDYQAEFDETVATMADYALQMGFTDEDGNGDVVAYLQDSYGPNATLEDFTQYLYDNYLASAYSYEIYTDIAGTEENPTVFPDEELEAYYDENSEMFLMYGIEKADTPNINVRHILIVPETADETEGEDSTQEEFDEEAADAAAMAEAERILEEWKSGEATEERFGELANTYSADSDGTDGGLYENVYPGQMVDEFNDWCFDSARQPGDTDIVETYYGYHIMYFVSATEDYYWKDIVTGELCYAKYQDAIEALAERYTATVTNKLAISTPDAFLALQPEVS